jgi:hypothetical protein
VAFARHQFWLNEAGGDGATRRDHMLQASRQLGRPVPELEGPACPPSLQPIWLLFLDLSGSRTMHAAGPNPITWPDLQAWAAMTGDSLSGMELAAIRALDRVFLHAAGEAMARRMKSRAS